MSTKHTPGPWTLPHFARPDVNCQCGYVLTGDLMGAVCTVHASGDGDDWQAHGDNPKFEEAVANARLIAAAPDMLAAIKLFLDEFDNTYDGEPLTMEMSKFIDMARAAVAKAEA